MISVELLHVAGCPNLDAARSLLAACLRELGLPPGFEEREGEFPSPTIRVNGRDVMDAPAGAAASCRLDLPTRRRLLAALSSAVNT